jgi:Ca2+-binding RTX toxin-like protein
MDSRWRDGTGLFTINDYNAADDQLSLLYAPSIDPNTSLPIAPTVTVHLSADGESSVILLNGVAVAEVIGVTTLTAADVHLEADTETDTGYRPEAFDSELDGTAGNDDLTGTDGEDYGRLGGGDDDASLGDGNDSVHGEDGEDSLHGAAGNDSLYGDAGADDLSGDAGNDMLNGGMGNDVLGGGDGNDVVQGGAGDDTVSGYDAHGAGGTASATDGVDTLLGGDGADHLIIGRGDSATGGTGADTFELDATLNDTAAFATINDYTRGTDRIELSYKPVFNAQGAEVPPVVRVLAGPNGSYSVITLNGDPLAHVMGVSNLALSEITLVREG